MCTHCRERLSTGEKHLCINCIDSIPRTGYYKEKENKLEIFFSGRFPFVRIASLAYFVNDGIIQSVIHELKYNNNPSIGIFIGELSGYEIKDSSLIHSVDYLLPIPLHPDREKERGYNQSQKIAEGISSITQIPVSTGNLIRIKNNVSQTKKSRFERWENTKDIFSVSDSDQFAGKHIMLIDDIITTGSTLESCAKTILQNCPDSRISIFSIGAVV